ALILTAALTYEVRYTIYRYPSWFGRQVVEYPFAVFLDSDQPALRIYTFQSTHIPGIRNGDLVLAVNGKSATGTAIFGEAIAKSKPGDSITFTVRSKDGPGRMVTVSLGNSRTPFFAELGKWPRLALFVLLPWFCVALGFWVAVMRVRDLRGWILLAVMLSFAGYWTAGAESWEPWLRDFGMAYFVLARDSVPIWLFLFGIYFPEP